MGKKSREKRERTAVKTLWKPAAGADFPAWHLAVLAGIAVLAYARTVSFDFVYDDELQILRNPWIRDWANVVRFFSSDVWSFATLSTTNYYRPLQMVAYALGHTLTGLRPEGYHVINILIHAAATVLAARVGFRLTQDKYIAVAGGLLFALHPIHAENVAWIAGVTDPLCAVFFFSALLLHIKDRTEPARFADLAVAGLFLGALLSKEMAFTFPAVAIWLDWCVFRKLRWRRYAVLAGVFALYALMRVHALSAFLIQQVRIDLDLNRRILNSIILFADYLAKSFVPYGISAFHVFEPVMGVLSVRFLAALLVLAVLGLAAWVLRSRRSILFLLGFLALTLMPVLNISGIGENIFADRYLYIPSFASCLLIPLLAKEVWGLLPERSRQAGLRFAGYGLLALAAVFGFVLWNVEGMWRDNPTLYHETMKRSPGSALIAANLGRYYFYRGDYTAAEDWFSRSLQLWDKSFIKVAQRRSTACSGLGSIRYQKGDLEKAQELFLQAYQLTPHDVAVLQNLGSVSAGLGNLPKALEYFQAAVRENPRNEVSYNNLAAVYLSLRAYDDAIREAQRAIEIYPQYGDAYMNLARAQAGKGNIAEARQAYQRAGQVDPAKASIIEEDLRALETPAKK